MQEIHLGIGSTPEEKLGFFLGEVPVNEFITVNALTTAIGLTVGRTQHSNEPWLKFLDPVDGKTKYVAKKPYRYSISWDQIHACGAAYGGTTVTIQGDTYKVRLLKGAVSDPVPDGSSQNDPEQSWGSEWNRLMYPLVPNPTNTPTHPISQEGILYGEWANYTEADLGVGSVNGRFNWCQESNGSTRLYRSGAGISFFNLNTSSINLSYYGWRPCLELVD